MIITLGTIIKSHDVKENPPSMPLTPQSPIRCPQGCLLCSTPRDQFPGAFSYLVLMTQNKPGPHDRAEDTPSRQNGRLGLEQLCRVPILLPFQIFGHGRDFIPTSGQEVSKTSESKKLFKLKYRSTQVEVWQDAQVPTNHKVMNEHLPGIGH